MTNKFEITVKNKETKEYPFSRSMLKIGTIYEAKPDSVYSDYGRYFLMTFSGLVCLDNPNHTWTYSLPEDEDKFFRMLPKGTELTLKVY